MVAAPFRVNLGDATRVASRTWTSAAKSLEMTRCTVKIGVPIRSKRPRMKRYLPFAIILAVFLAAIGAGALLLHFRQSPPPPAKPAFGKPGAEPPHIRGPANASVELEEFGDFECLPCFVLWPAMKNIEKD